MLFAAMSDTCENTNMWEMCCFQLMSFLQRTLLESANDKHNFSRVMCVYNSPLLFIEGLCNDNEFLLFYDKNVTVSSPFIVGSVVAHF